MTKRLPPANDWKSRNIDDWNTLTCTEYMKDKHREVFGIEYAPMRGWRREQGLIGSLIGTRTKEGTHSQAVVKAFIDEAVKTYKRTEQCTGTKFELMCSYRRNISQRLEAEHITKERRSRAKSESEDLTDLSDWL